MPTCVALAGARYPDRLNGHEIKLMQGVSLVPAWRGEPVKRQKPLFWEHEGNRAIRSGRWKLVAKGADGPWELYDLDTDRSELHDLAATQPQRVKELAATWQQWADTSDVLPLNPFKIPQVP
jgi:arylsulfatase